MITSTRRTLNAADLGFYARCIEKSQLGPTFLAEKGRERGGMPRRRTLARQEDVAARLVYIELSTFK